VTQRDDVEGWPVGKLYTPGNQNYNAVTNTPVNTNFLTKLGYKLYVKRAQHVNFFAQNVEIPRMSAKPAKQQGMFSAIPKWGDHVEYEPLRVRFIVDAEMFSYLELYHWFRGLTKPETFRQYRELMNVPLVSGEGQTSDIGVHVLSSTEVPKLEYVFHDCFPSALGGFNFESTNDDVVYVTVDATFEYSTFDVKKITQAWG